MGKYMMATKAYHKIGDISGIVPELVHVDGNPRSIAPYDEKGNQYPYGEYYVGSFVYGIGLFNVYFPVETTRELTKEEFDKYHNSGFAINGQYLGELDLNND